MSLVIDRTATTTRRPASKPVRRRKKTVVTRARTRVRGTRRTRSGTLVQAMAWVAAVTMFSFVFSSVLGNTMLESARRDRIRSVERTKEAREEVARLRRVLNSMTSMASVDRWATANSLVLSGVELPALDAKPSSPSRESQAIVAAVPPTPSSAAMVGTMVAMNGSARWEKGDGSSRR